MDFRYFYTHHATSAKFLEIQVFPDMDQWVVKNSARYTFARLMSGAEGKVVVNNFFEKPAVVEGQFRKDRFYYRNINFMDDFIHSINVHMNGHIFIDRESCIESIPHSENFVEAY